MYIMYENWNKLQKYKWHIFCVEKSQIFLQGCRRINYISIIILLFDIYTHSLASIVILPLSELKWSGGLSTVTVG